MVSLAALRWLADQDAAFVMLDRNGSVLATTGPVRPTDARLRRAQALAHQTGTALQIARELIGRKLDAQEKLARGGPNNCDAAETIGSFRKAIPAAETIEAIRLVEARGARLIGVRGTIYRSTFQGPIFAAFLITGECLGIEFRPLLVLLGLRRIL